MPSPNCSPYRPSTPLGALPDSLCDSAIAEALQATAELDFEAIAEAVPPRDYGHD